MKYSIILVLALAAIAYADELPAKKIEKRGIYGGLGLPLAGYGLGGLPYAAPLAAPISPYGGYGYGLGLGLGSPLIGAGHPLSYGYGGYPLGYGGYPLGYGGLY